jgi:hypothetical protein
MSFLSTVVKDAKAGFAWLASTKGQAIIGATEAGIDVAFPEAVPAIALVNTWMAEIIKVEGLATVAGAQSGTGVQKASLALSTMTPEVLTWAAANGYSIPDSANIAAINTAVVNVLNLLGASSVPATTTTTAATPVTAAVAIPTGAVDGGKVL